MLGRGVYSYLIYFDSIFSSIMFRILLVNYLYHSIYFHKINIFEHLSNMIVLFSLSSYGCLLVILNLMLLMLLYVLTAY